ncbi:carboxypeptidase regulatory-like domain-containing protein [Hymenobacter sp. RP-2-7]|uniref:Carboxypeptidase regulatory-like domain-containing protein n=1 Tax=Hymenobacter polaris TaxID=2682546 RepID=A0A7Y0AB18_9BACT|nr:carboxypeptidase-like regulatory domain-containing protein [Hymenobacter polaris]NML63800.1 carboxypeptidase regulatory-like domain-containing protein [Hymenobacter polaris]
MLSLPSLAASHEPSAKTLKTPKAPAKRTVALGAPAAKAAAAPAAVVPAAAPAAPQQVVLTGVVLLTDGKPCPGASVFMANAPRQLAVTNARGEFSLAVPAGNPVAIKADYFGVGSTRLALDQPSGQPLRLTLGR